MSGKLKKNIIQCKHCSDIIESKSQYDFKRCSCGRCGVDSGLLYGKRSFPSYPPEDHFIDLSEFE